MSDRVLILFLVYAYLVKDGKLLVNTNPDQHYTCISLCHDDHIDTFYAKTIFLS